MENIRNRNKPLWNNHPEISCIYKITMPDGRIYIGKTDNLKKRIWTHNSSRWNGKRNLVSQAMADIGGVLNCKIEILEEVDSNNCHEREMFFIDFYKTNIFRHPMGNGLNMTDGGLGHKGGKSLKGILKMDPKNRKPRRYNYIKVNHSIEKYNSISMRRQKLVLDFETGIYFLGGEEAAIAYNMVNSTLRGMLNGTYKNKTSLKRV